MSDYQSCECGVHVRHFRHRILCTSSGVYMLSHVTAYFMYAWCRPFGEHSRGEVVSRRSSYWLM